jgi:prevent-host-death family protein
MRQISASEVQKYFACIMDTAQKEPIIVRKHGHDYVAIISMKDYEDLVSAVLSPNSTRKSS